MPQTFFCIYTGQEFPESQRSLEHIVPYAIGGSDAFVTRDVSRDANSKIGTVVDASLVDDLRVTLDRMRLELVSQSGKKASLTLNGTTIVHGRPRKVRYTIGAGQSPYVEILPKVTWDKNNIEFHCTPDEAELILAKIQSRATKKGLTLSNPSINKSASWEELKIDSNSSIRPDAYDRCIVKIAIGTAHFTFGHTWSRSAHADRLRQCLHEPDSRKWPVKCSVPLKGPPVGFKKTFDVGNDKHIIVLLTQDSKPIQFTCMLFGDIYGSVPLTEDPKPRRVRIEDIIIYVIDCRTRALSRHTLIEFFEDGRRST